MQERTTRLRSQPSKRSGSRSVGRFRQARMKPVLDRVSRELVVPEDQSGSRVQPRDERAGQHREGVMIASLRSLDEFSLVHGHPLCRRGDLSRPECKSPWIAKGFPGPSHPTRRDPSSADVTPSPSAPPPGGRG